MVKVEQTHLALINIAILVIIAIKEILKEHKESIEDAQKKLTDERVERIETEIIEKNEVLEKKQKVIKTFIVNGVIQEKDIIENLNQESFVILYHYNTAPTKEIKNKLPYQETAIKRIINELGFVPVGRRYGSYFFHITNTKSLPKDLSTIISIEAYIRKKVLQSWVGLEKNIKASKDEKLLQKIKANEQKKGNLIYFISKVFPQNLSIGYLNFALFHPDFLTHYYKFVDSKTIDIDKQRLSDLITLASLTFFLEQKISSKDKKVLMLAESEIKNKFEIKTIFDYQTITLKDWKKFLSKNLGEEKTSFYANTLFNNIQEYCPIIKEFT